MLISAETLKLVRSLESKPELGDHVVDMMEFYGVNSTAEVSEEMAIDYYVWKTYTQNLLCKFCSRRCRSNYGKK